MSNKLGALWVKQGRNGEFMAGEIEIDGKKTKIVVFQNKKQNDRQPDWQILESEEIRQSQPDTSDNEINPEDIPF